MELWSMQIYILCNNLIFLKYVVVIHYVGDEFFFRITIKKIKLLMFTATCYFKMMTVDKSVLWKVRKAVKSIRF